MESFGDPVSSNGPQGRQGPLELALLRCALQTAAVRVTIRVIVSGIAASLETKHDWLVPRYGQGNLLGNAMKSLQAGPAYVAWVHFISVRVWGSHLGSTSSAECWTIVGCFARRGHIMRGRVCPESMAVSSTSGLSGEGHAGKTITHLTL